MKLLFVFILSLGFSFSVSADQNQSARLKADQAAEPKLQNEPTAQSGSTLTANEATANPGTESFDLKKQVDLYKQRYNATDVYSKITDNHGNGFEDLYGTRNLRLVLHGIYYRGGANNLYNREGKRDNMNPLPTTGIRNLCEEGFSEAIYLYPTNYASAPKSTGCTNVSREANIFTYDQISGLKEGNEKIILTRIFEHIKGVRKGPIYAHCWNGWHASGFVAAMSLQQFCKWTPSQALDYWIKNTDGNSKGYESIQKRVKAFKPFSDLQITAEEQALICPQR